MEPSEYKSTLALEVLASSLVTRLTLDELEWLSRQLAQRIEAQRRKELLAASHSGSKRRGAKSSWRPPSGRRVPRMARWQRNRVFLRGIMAATRRSSHGC